MPAEPLRAFPPEPEAEQPPQAPVQKAAHPMSLNEVLTGIPTPEEPREPETHREEEDRLTHENLAKLNELDESLELQAQTGAQEFKKETKSWWDRAKSVFKKKGDAAPVPVKGEADILEKIEQADQAFADFRKEAAHIMASGDEAGLRALENNLADAYERLAPQVAAEGAAESKAWKKALKTGEQPATTEAGARLNYLAGRLQDVRDRLSGKTVLPSKEESARVEKDLEERVTRAITELEAESVSPSEAAPVRGREQKPASFGWTPADQENLLRAIEQAIAADPAKQKADATKAKENESEAAKQKRVAEMTARVDTAMASEDEPKKEPESAKEKRMSEMVARVNEAMAKEDESEAEPEAAKQKRVAEMTARVDADMAKEDESEKKKPAFERLEAKLNDAAAKIIEIMPKEAENRKTFPTKVGRLSAGKYLAAFVAVGAISESEAKVLKAQSEVDVEEFNGLRKRLSQAVRQRLTSTS